MPACIHPITVKLPNGTPQTVACGRCVSCRINRTRSWAVRCMFELEDNNYNAQFSTFTYNDDCLPSDYGLHKRHLQLFFKRLRKSFYPRRIRYFAAGEYGDKGGRPHYHALIFGLSNNFVENEIVNRCWQQGFTYIGNVSWDSVNYVTKYIQKKWSGLKAQEVYGERQAPFQLQSQGLGLSTAQKYLDILNTEECIRLQNGSTVPIPYYFKRKLDIDTSLYDIRYQLKKVVDVTNYIDSEKIDKLYEYYNRMYARDLQREVNLYAKSKLATERSVM